MRTTETTRGNLLIRIPQDFAALVAWIFLGTSSALAHDELFESFVKTLQWSEQLEKVSHEFTLEIYTQENSMESDLANESVRLIREVFDARNQEFRVGHAIGTAFFKLPVGGVADETKVALACGNLENAKHVILDSASSVSDLSAQGRISCLHQARARSLSSYPIEFLIPVPGAAQTSAEDLVEFLIDTQNVVSEKIAPKIGGQIKSVKRYRAYRLCKMVDGGTIPVCYRIDVSADGFDKGLLLSVKQGFSKSEAGQYVEDEQVAFFDRTIDIDWRKIEDPKDQVESLVYPARVSKKFFLGPTQANRSPNASGEYSETLRFLSVDLPTKETAIVTLQDFEELVRSDRVRVNKVLNR